MSDNEIVLEAKSLVRTFTQGDLHVEVLQGVDMSIRRGERVAIIGASGSGKSTLLHCLGGLDRPDSGQVMLHGNDLLSLRRQPRINDPTGATVAPGNRNGVLGEHRIVGHVIAI